MIEPSNTEQPGGDNEPAATQAAGKINLLGMNSEQLRAFLVELGEKPFRVNQVKKWIHQYGVTDFNAMTDLSTVLRERLNTVAEIRPP